MLNLPPAIVDVDLGAFRNSYLLGQPFGDRNDQVISVDLRDRGTDKMKLFPARIQRYAQYQAVSFEFNGAAQRDGIFHRDSPPE